MTATKRPWSQRTFAPHCTIAAAALVTLLFARPAVAADPKVPPAPATSGKPIALLITGLDYTRPEISSRLARDGEGELIGWDLVDNDRTPYAQDTPEDDGTALAQALVAMPDTAAFTLLPVRINPADPLSLAKALAFVSRTPARTVLVPVWSTKKDDWQPFSQAAGHFKDLAIVARACVERAAGEQDKIYPRDLGLPIVVASPQAAAGQLNPWAGYIVRLPCRTTP